MFTNLRSFFYFKLMFYVILLKSKADDFPRLNQHFKITIIDTLKTYVQVEDDNDGLPSRDKISGYIRNMIDETSKSYRANFTYDLFLPSGYGASCSPQLSMNDTQSSYAKIYRTQ